MVFYEIFLVLMSIDKEKKLRRTEKLLGIYSEGFFFSVYLIDQQSIDPRWVDLRLPLII